MSTNQENLEMVTIPKEEYLKLRNKYAFLQCLEAGGVDNWEWWDEACSMYHDTYDEEKDEWKPEV